jgi:cation transporter-like permease
LRGGVGSADRRKEEAKMPLIQLILVLIVVGVLLWAVNSFIPMDGKIKNILNVVVIIAVVLWLLSLFGVFAHLPNIKVGK